MKRIIEAAMLLCLFVFCGEVKAQNIYTIAGNGRNGYSGDGGVATLARLGYTQGVAVDNSGNIYIADWGNGCVRKVNISGIITTIARLVDPTSVAVDSSGNVYIADANNHCVRKVSALGIITTIAGTDMAGYSGDGDAATLAQLNYPSGIAVDGTGSVYISDYSNSCIRKINSSGIITTIAGTGTMGYSGDGGAATAAQLASPWGVAVDKSGNVYIADAGNGRIRKISTSGIITTIAGGGTGDYRGDGWGGHWEATSIYLSYPDGVAVDSSGNVYIADDGNNCIRKVSASGIITTIAGIGFNGYSGDGWTATAAVLSSPDGVAVDGNGNVYIADYENDCIRFVGTPPTWLPIVNRAPIFTHGGSQSATTCSGASLSLNTNLAIADSDASQTETWSLKTMPLHGTAIAIYTTTSTGGASRISDTLIPTGLSYMPAPGYSGMDSFIVRVTDGTDSVFTIVHVTVNIPDTITGTSSLQVGTTINFTTATTSGTWLSSNTAVAVADSSSGMITGITPDTATISYSNGCTVSFRITVTSPNIYTIVGNGVAGYSSDGTVATSVQLRNPWEVAVDNRGSIYLIDNDRIRKINSLGIITTIAGTGRSGYSGDGGSAVLAKLNGPKGFTIDDSGNIYIADYGNSCIRKVSASGIITTIAGTGTAGYSGDGGAAASAQLKSPNSVAVDSNGNVYIADGNNHIRKVSSSGIITTIAGNGIYGYSGDGGAATSARLGYPQGVAVDGGGNIYIADADNNRIRKVNALGIITTIAGGGTANPGDGRAATSAALANPEGIAVDGSGNVYFADKYRNRIRKVNTLGIINTIAGTGTAGYSGDGAIATSAQLLQPIGIAIDSSANVYIADYYNNRIRLVGTPPTWLSATANHPPTFTHGPTQSATTCTGTSLSLNTPLAVTDSDSAQTEIWSIKTAPLHGTATVAYTTTSTGGTLTPTGLSYTPAAGYSGMDSFKVRVTDGMDSAFTTIRVTVTGLPDAGSISGPSFVATGTGAAFTESVSGGTWRSSNAGVATVSGTGVVRSVSTGADTISYTVTGGCGTAVAVKAISVGNHAPAFVYGARTAAAICYNPLSNIGSMMKINDADSGQAEVWTLVTAPLHGTFSGFPDTAMATGGTVIPAGIIYTPAVGSSGADSFVVRVNDGTDSATIHITIYIKPLPTGGVIHGSTLACTGHNDTLSGSPAGGTWFNSSSAVDSLTPAGVLMPIAPGTTYVRYNYTGTNGCSNYVLDTIMVRNAPVASGIAGPINICAGTPATFTNGVSSGIWSLSNANATIGSTGIATGVSSGADTISYTVNNGCGISVSTKPITIGATAGFINGPSEVCTGSYITLADSVAGGAWSTSNAAVATVNATGRVTSVAAGSATISYTVTSGCGGAAYATHPVTVDSILIMDRGTTSGIISTCVGGSYVLTSYPVSGTWFSSSSAVATISVNGTVTPVAPGTTTIRFTAATSGCTSYVLRSLTVHANPVVAAITGATSVCTDSTGGAVTDITPGGLWLSKTGNAVVLGGHLTGEAAGPDTILYIVTNSYGCTTTKSAAVTVNNCGAAGRHANSSAGTANTEDKIQVYPNPSNGSFTVALPAGSGAAQVAVYTMDGRLISSTQAAQGINNINLGSNIAPGFYLVRVQQGGEEYTVKIEVK